MKNIFHLKNSTFSDSRVSNDRLHKIYCYKFDIINLSVSLIHRPAALLCEILCSCDCSLKQVNFC